MEVLVNDTATQFMALKWILKKQDRKTCLKNAILQRWVLATLYFSIAGDIWLHA
jgi:hypothetical protein